MEYAVLIYQDEVEADKADYGKISPEYKTYTKQLIDSGVLREGRRLQRSSTATSVRVRDDEQLFTDGPFAEVREQLGGFYLIECADLDEALKWAAQCPGAKHGTVEVRPVAPS
ncbi:MAG TPA: YciI family protein [Amycolatopsis sp.]|uniref:YciI family protein n=1 Tax=Amycolatopsis sp. TaxID=37632 RepID=UPI002B46DDD1|nr:YciI family protein [Amycolatopsis sp.]HKS44268.1 YciI family protein [Amycolatopsis sp.]